MLVKRWTTRNAADGDQAGQRVKAADEEFMPAENRSNVCHFRLEAPWINQK